MGTDGLEFHRIGEVALKGFSDATELFTVASLEDSAVRGRRSAARPGRRGGPARARGAAGGDVLRRANSTSCWTWRSRYWAPRGCRRCTSTTACDPPPAGTSTASVGVRAPGGRAARPCGGGRRAARGGRQPAGLGWEVRYREANRLAGARGGVFATGHTASDQVETIVYRLAASPGAPGSARNAGQRGSPGAAPAGRHPRADGGLLPRAGAGVARGREQQRRALRPHPGAGGGAAGAAHRAPGGGVQSAAHGRAAAGGDRAARRPRGSRAGGTDERADRPPAGAAAGTRANDRGAAGRGGGGYVRVPRPEAGWTRSWSSTSAGAAPSCTSGAGWGRSQVEGGVLEMVKLPPRPG